MQSLIAEASVGELQERDVDIRIGSMLELAAGAGGYSEVFATLSSDLVVSDLNRSPAFERELAHIRFVEADVRGSLPFPEHRFDFIYCASLIEHLEDRTNLYGECLRMLAPGGRALFSFPPFWSLTLVGGHQFKPFHLLGERAAARWARVDSYSDHDLYPLTIRQVANELSDNGWHILDTWPRMWPSNTMRLPGLLADMLTWHACFLTEAA